MPPIGVAATMMIPRLRANDPGNGLALLNAALDYAGRGWPVLPVERRGKRPLIKNWPRAAATDPETVRKWFEQWPEANVGVLTGDRSGNIVVDVDQRNVRDNKALEAFLDSLPRTRTHRTGNGLHYLFRYVTGVPSTRLGNGVDLLADGRFVVMPPSTHPSGKPYAVHNDAPVADLPAALVASRTNGDGQSTDAAVGALLGNILTTLLARGWRRRGDELSGRCVFHNDHTPSATFNARRGCGKCHACGRTYGRNDLARVLGLLEHTETSTRLAIRRAANAADAHRWPGRTATTDRAVYLACCYVAHRAGTITFRASARADTMT